MAYLLILTKEPGKIVNQEKHIKPILDTYLLFFKYSF